LDIQNSKLTNFHIVLEKVCASLGIQDAKVLFVVWIKICVYDFELRTHKYLLILKECCDENEK